MIDLMLYATRIPRNGQLHNIRVLLERKKCLKIKIGSLMHVLQVIESFWNKGEINECLTIPFVQQSSEKNKHFSRAFRCRAVVRTVPI